MRQTALVPFRSFVWAGFECTSALTPKKRLDLLGITKHDTYCANDYELLKNIGIKTVREGLAWSQIDSGNETYDFSRYIPMMNLGKKLNIQQIWDLNHFDYPPDIDPFSPEFITRFARYAQACVKELRRFSSDTLFIVPINEISFFAWIGGDQGLWAPFARNRGWDLKQQLVKTAIASMEAMWAIDKSIRFIQVDPFLYRRPKVPSTPRVEKLAQEFSEVRFQSWDILSGRLHPELGGNPKYLDIVGVNYYPQNQEWIVPRQKKDGRVRYTMIPWNSPYRVSFGDLLTEIYKRYNRPLIITETGGWGELRLKFWRRTLREIDAARTQGIPILGICAYPILDNPDWHDNHLVNSGFWDFECDDETCRRIPHKELIQYIREYILKNEQNRVMIMEQAKNFVHATIEQSAPVSQ